MDRGSQPAQETGAGHDGPEQRLPTSLRGIADKAGNVWEWTSSLYKPYPYSATDGREDLNASELRVFRGGSWGYILGNLRSAFRSRGVAAPRGGNLGFRCSQ